MSIHAAQFLKPAKKASILLLCAYRWEAEPFIQEYRLQQQSETRFPVWSKEGSTLAVCLTGRGALNSAAISGALIERFDPIIVANFGVAGAWQAHWPIGHPLLINKVVDETSGQAFYPDRLLACRFDEAECITVARPANSNDRSPVKAVFDMESAGVFAAAELSVPTANIVVGKVVSDHLAESLAKPSVIRERIEEPYRQASIEFARFLKDCRDLCADEPRQELARSADHWVETTFVERLSTLHLTVSQQRQLKARLKAYALADQDPDNRQKKLLELDQVIDDRQGQTKSDHTKLLQRVLRALTATPLFSPVRRDGDPR